ncbi:hypothetical protein ATANTOWER_023330 [Ataeniobius toweri]|uniref:Uncharacterized protein n=1 Tax=Ataeniobius toweri TaxID=208326 RepID=A0ABU7CB26_9TELE|nr:hypothetical protein [Ataeniobius toweri]
MRNTDRLTLCSTNQQDAKSLISRFSALLVTAIRTLTFVSAPLTCLSTLEVTTSPSPVWKEKKGEPYMTAIHQTPANLSSLDRLTFSTISNILSTMPSWNPVLKPTEHHICYTPYLNFHRCGRNCSLLQSLEF